MVGSNGNIGTEAVGRPIELRTVSEAAAGSPADLLEAADGAACALAGIAEALEWRTAAYPDDMLELLAESVAAHAEALRAAL